jgi:hypothetical protein
MGKFKLVFYVCVFTLAALPVADDHRRDTRRNGFAQAAVSVTRVALS